MNTIYTNFYKIPNKIYQLNLSSRELLVLNYLLSFLNSPTINPSQEKIAASTSLSKRTVTRVIKSLKQKGFITYIKGGLCGEDKVSNVYSILLYKIDPNCSIKSEKQTVNEIDNDEFVDQILKQEYA